MQCALNWTWYIAHIWLFTAQLLCSELNMISACCSVVNWSWCSVQWIARDMLLICSHCRLCSTVAVQWIDRDILFIVWISYAGMIVHCTVAVQWIYCNICLLQCAALVMTHDAVCSELIVKYYSHAGMTLQHSRCAVNRDILLTCSHCSLCSIVAV